MAVSVVLGVMGLNNAGGVFMDEFTPSLKHLPVLYIDINICIYIAYIVNMSYSLKKCMVIAR